MKNFLLILAIVLCVNTQAQNVAVNNDGSLPNSSAILDVKSSTKGLLIPRMTTATIAALASPAKGLLVLDTVKNQLMVNMGAPASPNWQTIVASSGWSLTGNSGIDSATNFIGTTDTKPLIMRVSNVRSGYMDSINNNTSFGFRALDSFTTGAFNTAIGHRSLISNRNGSFNTASGVFSLYSNKSGSQNTAFGQLAMAQNISGGQNTALGSDALRFNLTGNANIGIGYTALYFNTSGYSNIALGTGALFNTGNRSNLVAVGDSALFNNGVGAVNPVDGSGNAAFGSKALFANTTGYYNTATGANALRSNSTGVQNTANGTGVLINNTIGGANTAMGLNAMFQNVIGNENTAIGNFALVANNAGSRNTGLGLGALAANNTGSNNTATGFAADVTASNLVNATAIGYNAKVAASNSLILGGTGADAVNVGIGIIIPKARLQVADSNVLFTGPATVPVTTTYDPAASGPGTRMMWYPQKAAFRTGNVNATQWNKDSIGIYSFAAGRNTKAKGEGSFATGNGSTASGYNSTAMGESTIASGFISTALGAQSKALSDMAFATGLGTIASGIQSTAMGINSIASGEVSTAIGSGTKAQGSVSTALGNFTEAQGPVSTAMGYGSIAQGGYTLAGGFRSVAVADYSVALGEYSKAKSVSSTVIGRFNDTSNTNRLFEIGNGTADNARSNALTVLINGNTGIGTTNPTNPLSINGTVQEMMRINGGNETFLTIAENDVNRGYIGSFAGNPEDMELGTYSSNVTGKVHLTTSNIPRLTVSSSGNIGIANINPTRPLSFPASLGEKILLYPGGVGEVGVGVYGNELGLHADNPGAAVSFGTQTNAGVFTQAGRFQISAPYALFVNGSIWANGTTYASDERFKQNISSITSPLQKLLQLNGVEYEMKTDVFHKNNFQAGRQMGLLAQNVEKIVPEAVNEMDGYKGVDYARLVPLLIEAIKMQQLQIETQQTAFNKHQTDILKQQADITELKKKNSTTY